MQGAGMKKSLRGGNSGEVDFSKWQWVEPQAHPIVFRKKQLWDYRAPNNSIG
jgi:hypothetical protein